MASSRFRDTWATVRQKMSCQPFQGMCTGEVASRPRPRSLARNRCRTRKSTRHRGAPDRCDGDGGGGGWGGDASLLKAASASAPAMINSEVKIDGRLSSYSGKAFLKR